MPSQKVNMKVCVLLSHEVKEAAEFLNRAVVMLADATVSNDDKANAMVEAIRFAHAALFNAVDDDVVAITVINIKDSLR